MRSFRWLGLPAAAALVVTLFALTAGIGSARTAVAPSNTALPTISGKAQVGELLTADTARGPALRRSRTPISGVSVTTQAMPAMTSPVHPATSTP